MGLWARSGENILPCQEEHPKFRFSYNFSVKCILNIQVVPSFYRESLHFCGDMKASEQLDLFPEGKLDITLKRLAHQLMEKYGSFEDVVFLGIQTKGVFVARRLSRLLAAILEITEIPLGELDTTFFRDDFRKRSAPLQPNKTKIDFVIEEKKVILVDDVLYTGRTVRAALDAMLAYGRPHSVELLVLVDRQHQRELPIEPSYVGIDVDTIETQRVIVDLIEEEGVEEDKVYLITFD